MRWAIIFYLLIRQAEEWREREGERERGRVGDKKEGRRKPNGG